MEKIKIDKNRYNELLELEKKYEIVLENEERSSSDYMRTYNEFTRYKIKSEDKIKMLKELCEGIKVPVFFVDQDFMDTFKGKIPEGDKLNASRFLAALTVLGIPIDSQTIDMFFSFISLTKYATISNPCT